MASTTTASTVHAVSEASKDVMLTMRTLGKKMSQVASITEASQLFQQLEGIAAIMQRFGIRLEASLIKPLPTKESELSEWAVLSSFAISIMRQRVHTAVKWLESNRTVPARVEAIRHFVSAVARFLDTGKLELSDNDDTVSFILGELQRDNSSCMLVARTSSASSASRTTPQSTTTAAPAAAPATPNTSTHATPTKPKSPTSSAVTPAATAAGSKAAPSTPSTSSYNKPRTMSTSAAPPREITVSPRPVAAATPASAPTTPAVTSASAATSSAASASAVTVRGRGARGRGARSETRKSGTSVPVAIEGIALLRAPPSPAAMAASPAHASHPSLPVAAPSPRRDVNELRSRFEQKLSSPALKTAVVVVTKKQHLLQQQKQQQQQAATKLATPSATNSSSATASSIVTPTSSKDASTDTLSQAPEDDSSPASAPSPTAESSCEAQESEPSDNDEPEGTEREPEPQTEPEPDFGIPNEPGIGHEAELESSTDLGAMSEPESALSPRHNKRVKSRRVQSAKIAKMAVHKQVEMCDEENDTGDSSERSDESSSPNLKRTSSFPTAPLESSESASSIAAPSSLSVPDVTIPLRPPTKSRSKSISAPESTADSDTEDTERKVIASATAASAAIAVAPPSTSSRSTDPIPPRSKKKSHLDAAKGARKRPQSFSQKILRRKEATPAAATNSTPSGPGAPSTAAYLKGTLRLYQAGALRGAWKPRFCVLTEDKLEFYKDEQATCLVRELPLGNITSMQKDKGKAKDKKEIGVVANITTSDSKLNIGFTDETQSSQWLLAIDGQRARVFGSCMETIERHVLLNQLFKEGFKGGNIKGPEEEEWLYRANGILKNTESLNPAIKGQSYLWDGETLRAKYKNSFGFGVWTGVTMQWYRSEEAYTSQGDNHNPVIVYYWDPLTREYHTASRDPKQTWKWTRHFLARKEGGGEWIMEGNVPEPVIMFLQLLRQTFEFSDDVVLHEPSTPSAEPRDEVLDGSVEL